jgi:His-Xaa-Ser system radical SAM maturase HxsB
VLDHSLVTNMTWMDEEKAEWLIDHEVLVCTSLDGPEELHNWNRAWAGGQNAWQSVLKWIGWFNRRYVEKGRDARLWHVDALMTTTRKSFDFEKEILDLYVRLGIRNIHLRPLNPYGFAVQAWRKIGYTTEEFLAFYARMLDAIIELNRQGVEIQEGNAAIFLVKLLTPDDPNFVDIRSPAGAGTGVVAYNHDGRIYPGDEARMIAAMGNDIFCLGRAGEVTYRDVVEHPTVRSMAVASIQDSLPACNTCWNKPFCGIDPVDNYMTGGDLFGQRPNSANCKTHYRIVEILLERLTRDPTGEIERIFRRWTIRRPRFEPDQA